MAVNVASITGDWRAVAAVFLLLGGAAKLLPGSTTDLLVGTGSPHRPHTAVAVGVMETALAVILVLAGPTNPISLIPVVGTVIMVGWSAWRRVRRPNTSCGCFGRLSENRTSSRVVVRAAVLCVLASAGSMGAPSAAPLTVMSAALAFAALVALSRPEAVRARLDFREWRAAATDGEQAALFRFVSTHPRFREIEPSLVSQAPFALERRGRRVVMTFGIWDPLSETVRDVVVAVRRRWLGGFGSFRILQASAQ